MSHPQHYRLLLVDDDPAFRQTLCAIFQPFFVLIEAGSGEEAVDLVERQPVDIVLLDMHMAELTGLETLIIIKSIYVVAPCILITADVTDELRQTASDADAFSVLHKPVSKVELVTTVSTAMEECYDDRDIAAALLN